MFCAKLQLEIETAVHIAQSKPLSGIPVWHHRCSYL